jgi:hypothetical protein
MIEALIFIFACSMILSGGQVLIAPIVMLFERKKKDE